MAFFDLGLLILASLLAGAFGTYVGAGTMITVPLMIFLGYPVHATIAANRFGVLGMTAAGYKGFLDKGLVDVRASLSMTLFVTIGAVIGTFVVVDVNELLLEKIIGIVMLVVLALTILKRNIGMESMPHVRRHILIRVVSCLLAGFYLGFLGLGAGMFLIYLAILVFGNSFVQAAGTIKIPGFVGSLLSFVVFWYHGYVMWMISILLFVTMALGSYIASRYADRIGNEWVRRLFIAAAAVMAIRLLL